MYAIASKYSTVWKRDRRDVNISNVSCLSSRGEPDSALVLYERDDVGKRGHADLARAELLLLHDVSRRERRRR